MKWLNELPNEACGHLIRAYYSLIRAIIQLVWSHSLLTCGLIGVLMATG